MCLFATFCGQTLLVQSIRAVEDQFDAVGHDADFDFPRRAVGGLRPAGDVTGFLFFVHRLALEISSLAPADFGPFGIVEKKRDIPTFIPKKPRYHPRIVGGAEIRAVPLKDGGIESDTADVNGRLHRLDRDVIPLGLNPGSAGFGRPGGGRPR